MNVEFIRNPTGPFGLSYNPGDVVPFDDEFAKQLIELGYAIEAKKFVFPDDLPPSPGGEGRGEGVETADSKVVSEKAIRKPGKK